MTHEQIDRLQRRAHALAIKWGYSEIADDFAQEAFVAIANGAHPKLEWLFIGFLREQYGSSRSAIGRLRQLAEKFAIRLDAPISEDSDSAFTHDIIGSSESNPESIAETRESPISYGPLTAREKEIAIMHFEEECSCEEIAQRFGVSSSRVSQILSNIRRTVTVFTEYKTLREQTLCDDHFMEIRLE